MCRSVSIAALFVLSAGVIPPFASNPAAAVAFVGAEASPCREAGHPVPSFLPPAIEEAQSCEQGYGGMQAASDARFRAPNRDNPKPEQPVLVINPFLSKAP